MEQLRLATIGGGYSNTPKTVIETVSDGGTFTTTAKRNGETLTRKDADNEQQALTDFHEVMSLYLQPLQAAAFSAGMVDGGKYTILHYTEFGQLVAQKIRFHSMEPCTYAQHGDAVQIICTPYRKRGQVRWFLYNKSFAIYEGWQDLPESATLETLSENDMVKVQKWKYSCWDANGFTACKGILKNRLALYEVFKRGVNSKMYA